MPDMLCPDCEQYRFDVCCGSCEEHTCRGCADVLTADDLDPSRPFPEELMIWNPSRPFPEEKQ